MSWGVAERAYYFGCDCADPLTPGQALMADCAADPSQTFLDRYASFSRGSVTSTGKRLGVPPDDPSAAIVTTARCVLNWLAVLFPNAAHVTPGWNGQPLPVVVIGCLNNGCAVSGTRIGICAVDGQLYLWAPEALLVSKCGKVPAQWVPWRGNDHKRLWRHNQALDCACPGTPCMPSDLIHFLFSLQDELNCPHRLSQDVTEAIAVIRDDLGHPADFDVIVPQIASMFLGDDDNCDRPAATPREEVDEEEEVADTAPASGKIDRQCRLEDSDKGPIACAIRTGSMLAVIRAIAIERVRTVVPAFGSSDLDHWIMQTGYGACAGHPEADIDDLFYVFAASLANAAGGRPPRGEFAPLVAAAIRAGGFLDPDTCCLKRAPTIAELCGIIAALLGATTMTLSARMKRFHANIGRVGTADHNLLRSIVEFAEWLIWNYRGCPCLFHRVMLAPPPPGVISPIIDVIRSLDALFGVGVSIAANFLKDSQIPGLARNGIDPRQVRLHPAGWAAKPDLHVSRLMAKLTRNQSLFAGSLMIRWPIALKSFGAPTMNAGMPGYFRCAYGPHSRKDLRVILDIHDWAAAVCTSPLEIERVLYLIGVRATKINGQSVSVPWYCHASAWIDAAIRAGVPRKS